uniref:Putative site-specific tyrosine recombinase n=1 Tax=viral metagenome TaxID=1070528 RepID=A0A6M3XXZ3_9ZZZZ
MPKRGESAEFALSQEQVQKVLSACANLEERVTIGLQLFLGLRASEACHFGAEWITDDGNFRIPTSQPCNCAECARTRNGMWKPKTKAGARTLPIPERMRKDIAELLRVKPYGLDISRVGFYYRTKTILSRAGIKLKGGYSEAFPHALRATCATMLATGGMNAVGLSYFMGWASISIGDRYIRLITAKEFALKQAREIFG